MGDITHQQSAGFTKITNENEDRVAGVEQIFGKDRLLVDSNISSVNVPLGKDPLPDTYFIITAAGAIGDTVRVQVAATANDSTSPDSNTPAVDVTYTLVAQDVGDERQLAINVANELNNDTDFMVALLEAEAIDGDKRAIVHVTSTEFSMNGEFLERPNLNDVQVTTTGTTTAAFESDDFKTLVSRAKEVSLGRDPSNPHRLGVQAVSGSVRVSASEVDQLFEEFALNGGSSDLTVDGSGASVTFTISANPGVNDQVKVIEVLKIYGSDGNIKVGGSNFLGLNAALTNGLEVRITKNNTTDVFRNVKTTSGFLARLSSSPEKSQLIPSSGVDFVESVFDLVDRNLQLKLEPGTTDKIEVVVQDNLSSVAELFFVTEGFLED